MSVALAAALVAALLAVCLWGTKREPSQEGRKLPSGSTDSTRQATGSTRAQKKYLTVDSRSSNLSAHMAGATEGALAPNQPPRGGAADVFAAAIRQLKDELQAEDLQIHGLIAEGGFGKVYRGSWRGLQVAVKSVLLNEQSVNTGAMKRAVAEVSIACNLHHPNIVNTFSHELKVIPPSTVNELTSYRLCLIQELSNGGTLDALMMSGCLIGGDGRANLPRVVNLLLDIAHGLRHMHALLVVHGDLNPSNVLLFLEDGAPGHLGHAHEDPQRVVRCLDIGRCTAKITDFGLSMKLRTGARHVSNIFEGTPFYSAPELSSQHRLLPASDVYSFGVVMWSLIHGCQPYVVRDGVFAGHPMFPGFHNTAPLSYALLSIECMTPNHCKRPNLDTVIDVLEGLRGEISTGWFTDITCSKQAVADAGPPAGASGAHAAALATDTPTTKSQVLWATHSSSASSRALPSGARDKRALVSGAEQTSTRLSIAMVETSREVWCSPAEIRSRSIPGRARAGQPRDTFANAASSYRRHPLNSLLITKPARAPSREEERPPSRMRSIWSRSDDDTSEASASSDEGPTASGMSAVTPTIGALSDCATPDCNTPSFRTGHSLFGVAVSDRIDALTAKDSSLGMDYECAPEATPRAVGEDVVAGAADDVGAGAPGRRHFPDPASLMPAMRMSADGRQPWAPAGAVPKQPILSSGTLPADSLLTESVETPGLQDTFTETWLQRVRFLQEQQRQSPSPSARLSQSRERRATDSAPSLRGPHPHSASTTAALAAGGEYGAIVKARHHSAEHWQALVSGETESPNPSGPIADETPQISAGCSLEHPSGMSAAQPPPWSRHSHPAAAPSMSHHSPFSSPRAGAFDAHHPHELQTHSFHSADSSSPSPTQSAASSGYQQPFADGPPPGALAATRAGRQAAPSRHSSARGRRSGGLGRSGSLPIHEQREHRYDTFHNTPPEARTGRSSAALTRRSSAEAASVRGWQELAGAIDRFPPPPAAATTAAAAPPGTWRAGLSDSPVEVHDELHAAEAAWARQARDDPLDSRDGDRQIFQSRVSLSSFRDVSPRDLPPRPPPPRRDSVDVPAPSQRSPPRRGSVDIAAAAARSSPRDGSSPRGPHSPSAAWDELQRLIQPGPGGGEPRSFPEALQALRNATLSRTASPRPQHSTAPARDAVKRTSPNDVGSLDALYRGPRHVQPHAAAASAGGRDAVAAPQQPSPIRTPRGDGASAVPRAPPARRAAALDVHSVPWPPPRARDPPALHSAGLSAPEASIAGDAPPRPLPPAIPRSYVPARVAEWSARRAPAGSRQSPSPDAVVSLRVVPAARTTPRGGLYGTPSMPPDSRLSSGRKPADTVDQMLSRSGSLDARRLARAAVNEAVAARLSTSGPVQAGRPGFDGHGTAPVRLSSSGPVQAGRPGFVVAGMPPSAQSGGWVYPRGWSENPAAPKAQAAQPAQPAPQQMSIERETDSDGRGGSGGQGVRDLLVQRPSNRRVRASRTSRPAQPFR